MKAIIIVLLLIAVPTLQDLVVECRDVQPNCTGAGFSITGSQRQQIVCLNSTKCQKYFPNRTSFPCFGGDRTQISCQINNTNSTGKPCYTVIIQSGNNYAQLRGCLPDGDCIPTTIVTDVCGAAQANDWWYYAVGGGVLVVAIIIGVFVWRKKKGKLTSEYHQIDQAKKSVSTSQFNRPI